MHSICCERPISRLRTSEQTALTRHLQSSGRGFAPGAGSTQRLPAVVGLAKAKELIFTGRRVDAREALAMGLVNRVAGTEAEALDLALELAGEIAAGGPLGVRMAKRALHRGHEAGPEAGLQAEDECYQVVLESADRREALRAFAAKEAPLFAGK